MSTYSSNTTRKSIALPSGAVVLPNSGDVDWFTVPAASEYLIDSIIFSTFPGGTELYPYIKLGGVVYLLTPNLIGGASSSTNAPPYNQTGNAVGQKVILTFIGGLKIQAGAIIGFRTVGAGVSANIYAIGTGQQNTP